MIPEFIAAAIAAIGALKKADTADNDRQNAINDAEQQMWDKRNAEVQARRDAMDGIDPRRDAFARQLDAFGKQVDGIPVERDWLPLVQAGGRMASSIYGESQRPTASAPSKPIGQDIPGQNFSPAGNYAAPVNYSEWQPVEHKAAGSGGSPGNMFSEQARRFEEEDERSLPAWLR
jgi:hypothetical protein